VISRGAPKSVAALSFITLNCVPNFALNVALNFALNFAASYMTNVNRKA